MRFIALIIFFTLCTFFGLVKIYSNKPFTLNSSELIASKKEHIPMIDFTKQNLSQLGLLEPQDIESWRITNDGVMGGQSQGSFSLQASHALFAGHISLENNGGFSSVFRSIKSLNKGFEKVSINIKGDGLTYQLRMSVKLDGYRLAYKHNFTTVAGQQKQLTFLLADFQASFRGRNIPNAPVLLSENILEVGFLVSSKVAGAFSLAISSVDFK